MIISKVGLLSLVLLLNDHSSKAFTLLTTSGTAFNNKHHHHTYGFHSQQNQQRRVTIPYKSSQSQVELNLASSDDQDEESLQKKTVKDLKQMVQEILPTLSTNAEEGKTNEKITISSFKRKDDYVSFLLDYYQHQQHHSTHNNDSSMDIEMKEEDIEDTNSATFSSLGCNEVYSKCAHQMKWQTPTPVQKIAIPNILQWASTASEANNDPSYKSIWCEAPTGSGKTGAYALPLMQLLAREKRDALFIRNNNNNEEENNGGKIKALVLVPTRELAIQTKWVFDDLNKNLPKKNHRNFLTQTLIHGGVPMEPQIHNLAKMNQNGEGVDILIATPGRLMDIIQYYTKARKVNARNNKNENDESEEEEEEEFMTPEAADAALERRLLEALDSKEPNSGKKDSSLSLNDLLELDLDTVSSSSSKENKQDDDTDGRKSLHQMLNSVQYLVIDEADKLLGFPFQSEMDPLLKLLSSTNEQQQQKSGISDDSHDVLFDYEYQKHNSDMKIMLFSATYPEQIQPRVEKILQRIHGMKQPLRLSASAPLVSTSSEDSKQNNKYAPQLPSSSFATDTITLRTIRLEERDRTQALRHLIETNPQWDKILVFTATRYTTQHVARKLRRYNIQSLELHGKLEMEDRVRRLEKFRSSSSSKGGLKVLLATDLACRGLDISDLPTVVNYDLPRSTSDFVHRCGRTGRAGKEGLAITFVTPKNEAHYDLIERRELSSAFNNKIPERETLPQFLPDETSWAISSQANHMSVPGAGKHSDRGLAFDKMHGGVKGRRKSKKDKLREQAALKLKKQSK